MNKIKNIIFDLGGVVIDIDFDLTIKAFAELTNSSIQDTKKIMEEYEFYDKVERGLFTRDEFCEYVSSCFELNLSKQEVTKAWNSLLLNIDLEKVNLIKELSSGYNLYVLSNTSELHVDGLNIILEELFGISDLQRLFKKVYYSYDIGFRKPELDIYKYVLLDAELAAEETLFIDDNLDNLVGAEKVGIKTLHIPDYNTELVLHDFLQVK